MNNIKAIFIKQFVNQIKVPYIMGLGLVILIMAGLFMLFVTPDDDCNDCIPAYVCVECEEEVPDPTIVGLFSVMFVGLMLLNVTSSVVGEDKSTKNLQFMAMADVRPYQYLLGTFPSLMIFVTFMWALFALFDGNFGMDFLWFLLLGMAGGSVSVLLGITLGLSKVAFLAFPISMVIGLGPTLSVHNQDLARALGFTFVQQVRLGIADLGGDLTSNFTIIGLNGLVVLVAFVGIHYKNRFTL